MEDFIKAKIEEARGENRDIPPIMEEMFLHMARSIDNGGKPPKEEKREEPKQLEYSGGDGTAD
jgi:hypothetical protein